jgi:hypothetical protein
MYPYLNIHNSSPHSHPSEEKFALEIAAKIANVHGPLKSHYAFPLPPALLRPAATLVFPDPPCKV